MGLKSSHLFQCLLSLIPQIDAKSIVLVDLSTRTHWNFILRNLPWSRRCGWTVEAQRDYCVEVGWIRVKISIVRMCDIIIKLCKVCRHDIWLYQLMFPLNCDISLTKYESYIIGHWYVNVEMQYMYSYILILMTTVILILHLQFFLQYSLTDVLHYGGIFTAA